ncbi:tetraspanin-36-like [Spea bombifrons]|uniref:tetraspanin-36-like n=1 Tax=Spea bombifrons TaxID=233779 RepID=UPI0023490370|nr:tetraspanin-36-like [Spea bombifrons]
MGIGVFTSKTFLILLSLFFLAAASGLTYVGVKVITTYKQYENFLGNTYIMLPAVIILCVAVAMFFIGFLGCCATMSESAFCLGCFMFLITAIFAAGVTALVLGLVYKDKINPELEKNMNNLFQEYDGKNVQSSAVDFIQEQLVCCGVKNYTSWRTGKWHTLSANDSAPLSCCKKNSTNCDGSLSLPDQLNTEGCEMKLETLIHKVLSYSLLVILGFVIVELCGMISMCVIFCRDSRDGYQLL